ncbi:hypothetical protein [Rhodohalobacter sp.]|uniref:hypothetical protein n=1 Tax=Rhodohalobacter sp. TaxID=1974210 RepID=UPI002ACDC81E|nr:hypothetical protein [Rhodohalobacter sp.]MDZ7755089.1 hypothetical protein [Rhodohalobacter sp.]
MKIYLLFLLFFQSAFSEDSVNNDYTGLTYTPEEVSISEGVSVAIHPEDGSIYLYFRENGNILQFSESGQVDTLGTFTVEFNKRQIIDVHPNGNELLFWDSGLGRVHSFDLNTLEFTRLDESHNHMNQFGHAATLDEMGNIYAMGGYGYWEFKNQLIYYSQNDKQWQLHSKPDPEIVPKNSGGRLFRTHSTFYYFVKPTRSNTLHSFAYKYLPEENEWVSDHQLNRLFSQNFLSFGGSHSVYAQTSTYAIDRGRNLIGLLYSRNQSDYAYIVDLEEKQTYRFDLSQLNIYNSKNLFYVPGKDHWVILGHPFSTNRRDQLILRTFEFDLSHPALSVVQFQEEEGFKTIMILGTFGGLFLIIIGWFVYRNILSNGDRGESEKRSKSSPYIMEISKDDEEELTVYFEDKNFSHSGDVYLSRMFEVIYQMKREGISEILISDLDQKLFSENTHSSYKSRTRRKVIQVINSESDYEIIEEKKSQTDKRIKVIDVNLDKIKINPQVS